MSAVAEDCTLTVAFTCECGTPAEEHRVSLRPYVGRCLCQGLGSIGLLAIVETTLLHVQTYLGGTPHLDYIKEHVSCLKKCTEARHLVLDAKPFRFRFWAVGFWNFQLWLIGSGSEQVRT